jgi:hypothetical protein
VIYDGMSGKSGFGCDENLRMVTCAKKVYDEEVVV